MKVLVWLLNHFTPETTFEDKTMDGLTLREAKALASILAYWLALSDPTPHSVTDLCLRKQVWTALGKEWVEYNPDWCTEDEIARSPADLAPAA